MTILFPESGWLNTVEFGSCSATGWPRPDLRVFTNDGDRCEIKTLSVRYIDTYTTAVFFRIYVNSSCKYIFAWQYPNRKRNPLTYVSIEQH